MGDGRELFGGIKTDDPRWKAYRESTRGEPLPEVGAGLGGAGQWRTDGELWRRLWWADWSDEVEGRLHEEVVRSLGFGYPHRAWAAFHSTELLQEEGRRLGWGDEEYLRWARRVGEIEREEGR